MKLFGYFILLFLIGTNVSQADKTYVIGRAPQISSITLAQQWAPFIKALNDKTPYSFRLRVFDSRTEFEKEIISGSMDMFFGNPGYLIVARRLHGYVPLIRSGKKKLKGILVVEKNSPIHDLTQLESKMLAFPHKNAFAASLYIRSLLKSEHNLKFISQYANGHDNVYRGVATGHYAAGGGVYRTLNNQSAELKSRLRIIYETPGMSPHPLSAHKNLPQDVREAVIAVALSLNKTDVGRKILKTIKLKQPVRADYKRDYHSIKVMALKMYASLVNQGM